MDATQAMSAQHTMGHRADTPLGGVAVVTIERAWTVFAAEAGRRPTGLADVGDTGAVAGSPCSIAEATCDATGRENVYRREHRRRSKGWHDERKSPERGDQW